LRSKINIEYCLLRYLSN